MWILYAQLLLLVLLSFFAGCAVALVALRARLGAPTADPVDPTTGGTR